MPNATTFNRILSKGIESELPKVVDGRLRFTTDTGRLFLDNGNERVEISDFVKGQTSTQITGTLAPLPKFYLASDTNVLYFYAGGQWNTVKAANASTADYSNNASTANYAKNAINTITRSGNTFTATRENGTTFTFSQQNSTYTNGEGLSLSSGTFSINKNASTVAYATKAGSATSATNATNAESATNAGTANYASTAANGIESITRSGKNFTVTRQDGSTFGFDQQDDNQTYKAGEGLSLNSGTFSINKDASTVKYAINAGSASNADNATCATNASSVGGFTVGKSVPSNAVFTDTTYSAASGGGLTLSSGAFSINKDASTAKYATNSGTATYATNAGSATSAANATCAANASSVGGFTVGKSVPSNAVFTDTTYANMTSATAGLAPAGGSGTTKYLRQDGSWQVPPDNNTTYGNMTSAAAGLAPAGGSGTTKYLRQDGSWQVPPDNNTTYGNATTAAAGLLPTLAGGTEKYLRADGTWVKPPNDNTTYGNMTSATAGLAPAGGSGTTKYLRQDGSWQVPPNDNTKNTAGSTDTSSKIFLIGATSQAANPQTYSHDTAYVGTDGCLYSGGIKVLTAETDPTVPSWAKASSKPTYTASEVGALSTAVKGAVNGVAELDSAGKVPSSQLPSYVDDIIEGYYYNSKFYEDSAHTTEITPESGKIYVDLSTDKTYRWSGTAYTQIKGDLALGETSTTAYRGDRGKIAYDHSQAAHAPSNAQPNQNAFSNVKVGSTTITADTTTDTLELVASGGITLTPDATNDKLTISSTTYGNMTSTTAGLAPAGGSGTTKYLRQDGSWQVPPNDNTTYGNMTSAAAGLAPAGGSGNTKYLRQDGSWQVPPNDNTTYGTFSTAANGLVPKPASAATTSYLNSSGTWTTPVGTTYSQGTGISISAAKAISLATTGTAGTYGPSANVTGNEGATISVPQITTDSYGRVTSVTNRTYTSKNTTYDLSAATVNTSTYSNRPMVEADFDFGELNSTTPGDESYNS